VEKGGWGGGMTSNVQVQAGKRERRRHSPVKVVGGRRYVEKKSRTQRISGKPGGASVTFLIYSKVGFGQGVNIDSPKVGNWSE